MCPIYTPCLTALESRCFSTEVGGAIIFCQGEIERKFVTGVLRGIGWKMNFNSFLS